jgi:lipoprotein-anchoring transpeptidase ErfK/SrfK
MKRSLREAFGRVVRGASKDRPCSRILRKQLLVVAMLLAGCAADRESATSPFLPTRTLSGRSEEHGDEIPYWNDVRSGGEPRIIIDLQQQRASFYRGDKIVGISPVSTGREGYNTPSGEFRVTQKDLAHVSTTYGNYVDRTGQVVMENVDITKSHPPRGTVFRGAPMPYFLRIHGAIGMHAGYLPGYPASHGCIRLPKDMAIRFFQDASIGTPVAIRQESPGQE